MLTAQPGPLPRLLQQPLRLGWRFCCPCPCTAWVPGPGDLIVLKHSSNHEIFQCPLSLVSDLHICWNTVGCFLCSSDQLGISLALRGSGLRSHLCCRHLPAYLFSSNLPTLKETEASLSHVQCSLYLVSSSINVSFFFILHGWIPSGQTSYIKLF